MCVMVQMGWLLLPIKKLELPGGWFHKGDIKQYRSLVEQVPDNGKVIELGVWKGRSLCSIADIIIKKKLTVYAVDTFKGSPTEVKEHKEAKEINLKKVFLDNIKKFKLKVKTYEMTTNEAAEQINEKFDLIFIDADHTE